MPKKKPGAKQQLKRISKSGPKASNRKKPHPRLNAPRNSLGVKG